MEDKEKNIPEPRVTLFGEDIGGEEKKEEDGKRERKEAKRVSDHKEVRYHACCGGHRSGCCGGVWGLVVFFSGTVLLMNTLGLIPWEFWGFVWSFWPALLILAGVRILLGGSVVSRLVSFVLALAVFAFVMIFSLIRVDSPFVDFLPGEVVDFVDNIK